MCLPVLIHKRADKQEYKTALLFPHYTLRMGFLNHRKEYYTKLLSGEKGGPKGRKLCLLSVRIQEGFAGRYEPGLIGRQESRLDS